MCVGLHETRARSINDAHSFGVGQRDTRRDLWVDVRTYIPTRTRPLRSTRVNIVPSWFRTIKPPEFIFVHFLIFSVRTRRSVIFVLPIRGRRIYVGTIIINWRARRGKTCLLENRVPSKNRVRRWISSLNLKWSRASPHLKISRPTTGNELVGCTSIATEKRPQRVQRQRQFRPHSPREKLFGRYLH